MRYVAATMNLNSRQFAQISAVVNRVAGINLKPGKEALVHARLMKRLRALGIDRVEDYFDLIESAAGSGEVAHLIDVMTTNKTSFFRGMEHFEFLRDEVLPQVSRQRLRFWSAACSSGEEPYSLAVLLREHLPGIDGRDVRILATDISHRMLAKARQAAYPLAVLQELPSPRYGKYFLTDSRGRAESCRVAPVATEMVHLAYLNLMGPWPMKGPFQVVFCRNVMIYFDLKTQQDLIHRLWEMLEPGGYLFVGHAEGLSSVKHRFRYVRPAVYRK